jgi:adenosine deaminase CECR1
MSHEFYQIMVGAPSISLYSWKQLARWSIDYSCLSKEDQLRGHEILKKDWQKFCHHVVDVYGPIMDGDEIDLEKAKKRYADEKVPSEEKQS